MEGLSQVLELERDGDRDIGHGGFEPLDPSSGDDGDEVPQALSRSTAIAGKRPFFPDPEEDDSSDDAQDARLLVTPTGARAFFVDPAVGPDLSGYLDCFAMPVRERVLLCRSFASYLVAQGNSGIRRPGPKSGFKAPRRV